MVAALNNNKKTRTIHGEEGESDLQSYYIIVLAMFISPQVKGIDRDHAYENPGTEYARKYFKLTVL